MQNLLFYIYLDFNSKKTGLDSMEQLKFCFIDNSIDLQ